MILVDYPLALFVISFIVLWIILEIGFRFARRAGEHIDPERHEQIVGTRNDVAVLLSLLLGFTLAMVLSRYDLRKQLVVEEANAIETTGLRARMLPESARDASQELLREYTDARIAFSEAGLNTQNLEAAIKRSKRIQNDLWQQAIVAARQNPTAITGLFISSLNETIDLDTKRWAALKNRIPAAIWLMLALLSVLTCLMVGYSYRRRFVPSMLVPPLMIAIVVTLIADLDTPGSGLIRIGHESIERLKADQQTVSPNL
jgi:hypothetical protein